MLESGEVQNTNDDIKNNGNKKITWIISFLIISFLLLSSAGFYAYKNNLFQEKSANQMTKEIEENISVENIAVEKIVDATLVEGEKLESENN